MRNGRMPPRPVDFNDLNGPDAMIVNAIAYGKGYRAAAKMSNSTPGQVSYRLMVMRRNGVAISPRAWRESALPEDERKLKDLDRRYKAAAGLLGEIQKRLRKAAK